MAQRTHKILLIAASPMGMSFLATRLKQWACEIQFASSCRDANMFVCNEQFDVVLSEYRLWNNSPDSFTELLLGSNTTLVYSYSVENGCWWLPAVRDGHSCWGSSAMQPSEFIGFLDDVLKEIRESQAGSPVLEKEMLFKVAAK